jgi:uncharacterized protein (DUF433 family)
MLTPQAEPIPLTMDEHGVMKVSGTRVPLDTIIGAFNDGASAEEIALSYPSVLLPDIYAVITYYLRHKEDVDAYVAERERSRAETRWEVEARFNPIGIRERLLARRKKSE